MITSGRILEIERKLGNKKSGLKLHENDCSFGDIPECDCAFGIARELLTELKDSLSREKKKREEVSRFAKNLTEWIESQINP